MFLGEMITNLPLAPDSPLRGWLRQLYQMH